LVASGGSKVVNREAQNDAPTTLAEETMNIATQRSIFRWIHIIFSIPILGYIYCPFEKFPDHAPATRFVFLPVMVLLVHRTAAGAVGKVRNPVLSGISKRSGKVRSLDFSTPAAFSIAQVSTNSAIEPIFFSRLACSSEVYHVRAPEFVGCLNARRHRARF
jgi:hypothetical protein